jgi:hypothetical protein
MNPQRSDLLPNLRATLGLVGAGLLGVGLGVGIAAGIYRDGAPLEAIPQAAAMALAIAPPATPDPLRNDVDASARPFDIAGIVSVGLTVPVTPPETMAPDPVQSDVEAPAPTFELAGTGSVVAALPDPHPMLPPAAPPEAIAPAATPDPVQDDVQASASPIDVAATESAGAAVSEPGETLAPAAPPVLVSLFRSAAVEEDLKPVARVVEVPNECLVADICIDDYLWAFYERTPKVDTNKVKQRIKALVKKKGKTRTVTRTVTRYVVADFTWKDPIAAQRAGMSVKDYVIGGMDRRFKLKLYYALRTMDEAGLMPGITSAFRDDYRQGIASGNKAASDSSYHGGSRRGGYGHGLAADLVSVKGDTRLQRFASTVEMWKWIDAREQELGIGRPYLNRDPPHVGPIDGKEYADKRGRARAKLLGPARNARHPVAGNPGVTKPEAKAGPVKVGSI